jgi:hypothetical protein
MTKETKGSKGGAKKKPERKPPAPVAGGPLVDPSHSAAAAAAMVGHKVAMPTPATGAKAESSTFRNLKESLSKPNAIGGVLDKLAPPTSKKSGMPFAGGKQVGHNQTYGADVNRRGVPRRTAG